MSAGEILAPDLREALGIAEERGSHSPCFLLLFAFCAIVSLSAEFRWRRFLDFAFRFFGLRFFLTLVYSLSSPLDPLNSVRVTFPRLPHSLFLSLPLIFTSLLPVYPFSLSRYWPRRPRRVTRVTLFSPSEPTVAAVGV